MAVYKTILFSHLKHVFFYRAFLKISVKNLASISYDHRTSITPLLYKTYCDILDTAVEKSPDKPAVTSCHQEIAKSYQELHTDVLNLAAGFLSVGLSRGTKVALMSPSNYEWIISQYALAYAGLVMVTVNPAFTAPEISYVINKSKSEAVIIADCFKSTNYLELMRKLIPNLDEFDGNSIKSTKLPMLRRIITMEKSGAKSTISFNELANLGNDKELKLNLEKVRNSIQSDDPVAIQFTSGTTGNPKAAVLTHHGLINNANWCVKALQYTEKDAICLSVPLFHCFANVLGSTASGLSNSKLVLPSPSFSPKEVLKVIDVEKCTTVYGSPTMFSDLVNHPDFNKYNYSTLRGGLMAAAPCPIHLLKTINEKMNMRDVCVAYGTTENSPLIAMTDVSDSLEIRCRTVGKTIGHVETKVIDAEGKIVERGQIGELCARGYQVMLGYFENEEKTKEAIGKDKWYKTGDLATMDIEGYIKIVGRIKDMIIRGGENIYPTEIEEFLLSHSSIAEVQVFGIPDDRLGEVVGAWIKLKINQVMTQNDVVSYCSGKLAKFKIPLHVRFVNDFPKLESGKIKKIAMTEAMVRELST